MKKLFGFYVVLFLTCFFMLVVSVSDMYAGALGKSVGQKSGDFFSTNSGNQTVVNVEKSDKDLAANEDKSYKESKITITADILPVTAMSSMGGRQVSEDSFMVGVMYKIDEHWQGVLQAASLKHKSIDEVLYESKHYMAGVGLRWTIGAELDKQIQINGGATISSEIKKDGEGVGDYELPVWAEAKYLWCSDNTAWGLKLHVMDVPNKADNDEDYRNYGYVIATFNFEVGIK